MDTWHLKKQKEKENHKLKNIAISVIRAIVIILIWGGRATIAGIKFVAKITIAEMKRQQEENKRNARKPKPKTQRLNDEIDY